MPAGPSAVLAYARAAEGRFREARAVVVGRMLAEGLYAMAGWWGMSHLLKAIPWIEPFFNLVVGIVLPFVGIYLLRWTPKQRSTPDRPVARLRRKGFALGFSLTFLNPTVIASWGAVSGLLAATGWFPVYPRHAPLFGLGIAMGAWLWFAFILRVMERRQGQFKPRAVLTVIRSLGVLLVAMGVWLFVSGARYFAAG